MHVIPTTYDAQHIDKMTFNLADMLQNNLIMATSQLRYQNTDDIVILCRMYVEVYRLIELNYSNRHDYTVKRILVNSVNEYFSSKLGIMKSPLQTLVEFAELKVRANEDILEPNETKLLEHIIVALKVIRNLALTGDYLRNVSTYLLAQQYVSDPEGLEKHLKEHVDNFVNDRVSKLYDKLENGLLDYATIVNEVNNVFYKDTFYSGLIVNTILNPKLFVRGNNDMLHQVQRAKDALMNLWYGRYLHTESLNDAIKFTMVCIRNYLTNDNYLKCLFEEVRTQFYIETI